LWSGKLLEKRRWMMEKETIGYKIEINFKQISFEAWICIESLSVGPLSDFGVSGVGFWVFLKIMFLVD